MHTKKNTHHCSKKDLIDYSVHSSLKETLVDLAAEIVSAHTIIH